MSEVRNPFTRTGALRLNHPLFRGRAAELERLERACLSEHDSFLLVYGGRQNGKTSLLLRLEARLRTQVAGGVRVCRVDFQGLPRASSRDAYRHLAQRVATSLPQAPQPPDSPDAPGLGDFIEQALAGAEVTRLVLLLDELGTLPDPTREDLAHVLRSLHTRQRDSPALAKAQFVLAGGIELYNLAVVEASALRNVCEIVRLGDLCESDAVGLIADGLAATSVAMTHATALGRAVYACVNGHPYLTQRLGELLADQHQRGDTPEEVRVEQLAWTLLEEDNALLEHLRRSIVELRLEDAARRLLLGNQRTRRTDDNVARLELLGLAGRLGGHWAPRNPLLAVALSEWLNLSLPAGLKLPEAAGMARQVALAHYLRDLKLEQAATEQRVVTAATVAEQVRLQHRANELADEISRIEASRQPVPPSTPAPTTIARPPAQMAGSGSPTVRRSALPSWMPELVHVPASSFLMGSSDADTQAHSNEKPQHTLELPDYWISKTPVTNAQFRPFVEGDGYTNRNYWTEAGWKWREQEKIRKPLCWNDPKWNGAAQPVVGVSWFEAVAYCRWLSAQTGQEFRLPSKAEWEKAARGPEGQIWPWGNTWEAGRCNSGEAGIRLTTAVEQYPVGASPYGALDMAGNAWEWCATRWGKRYPYQVEDELGGADPDVDDQRVMRGGSWGFGQEFMRGAYRSHGHPRGRENAVGMRIATDSTVIGQIRLQHRAGELAEEIGRIETARQPTPPSTPAPVTTSRPRAQVASSDPAVRRSALPAWIPELVCVRAGPFLMGSSDADRQADAVEKPQHRLVLPNYWIGKTPVTNAHFRPFVEGDGYRNKHYWTTIGWQWREQEGVRQPFHWENTQLNGDTQPAVGVSWFEAVAYCRWLSAQTGHEFGLPSEAEREKAARGPDGRLWPWGDTWDSERCNSKEAGIRRTTLVEQYPGGASPYGVLDMAGNIWEWCATGWLKRYPYQVEDEWLAAYLEMEAGRVFRGGSYYSDQKAVRGAYRGNFYHPSYRGNDIGLRVASHSLPPASGL